MICSVGDCQKENHSKYPTRCWTHRAKKWAQPIVEPVVVPIVEPVVVPIAEPIVEDIPRWSDLIAAGDACRGMSKADHEARMSLSLTTDQIRKVVFYTLDRKLHSNAAFEAAGISGDGFDYEEPSADFLTQDVIQWLKNVVAFATERNIPIDANTQTIIERAKRESSCWIDEDGDFAAFERLIQALKTGEPVAESKMSISKRILSIYKVPTDDFSRSDADMYESDDSAHTRITKADKHIYFAFRTDAIASKVADRLEDDLSDAYTVVLRDAVEQKNEEPELIQVETKIVAEDIASPMSPNSTTAIAPTIVEETKCSPVKTKFDEYECFIAHKGTEAQYWIDKCALGEAYATLRMIMPGKDTYMHETRGCRVIMLVNHVGKRAYRQYAWFYNQVDMHAFVKYFHSKDRECHEVFLGRDPTIKFFFDIEKVITKDYYKTLIVSANDTPLGEMIASDMMHALRNALELVDERYEEYSDQIDCGIAERNRSVGEDSIKISYHVITKIAMKVSECKALIRLIKADYIDTIPSIGGMYKEMLCEPSTIDSNPYRKNGSLSLPGGSKNGNVLKVIHRFKRAEVTFHLLDTYASNRFHDFTDDLLIKPNQTSRDVFEESSSEFIQSTLAKIDSTRVPAYDPNCMDLYANPPRGNFVRVGRTKPSYCPECNRTHDNADTFLLIFNEEKAFAWWKCSHNEDMSGKRWFGKHAPKEIEVDIDHDEVEAFGQKVGAKVEAASEKSTKKQKPAIILKQKLIKASQGVYKREFGTGRIYKLRNKYHYTIAHDDPKQFLNDIFAKNEMYHMCSQSDHRELLHFIKDVFHPEFPFLVINYDFIGFSNGVYRVSDATFIKKEEAPAGIQVRVYHDFDFEILGETPRLDKYFGCQFDGDTTECIYFMIGRAMT